VDAQFALYLQLQLYEFILLRITALDTLDSMELTEVILNIFKFYLALIKYIHFPC